jgi:hypothetical protein
MLGLREKDGAGRTETIESRIKPAAAASFAPLEE